MAIVEEQRVRPSAWWYSVVVVAWVAAAITLVLAYKPLFDALDTNPTTVQNGDVIAVPDDGVTIYSSQSSGVSCHLSGSDGSVLRLTDAGAMANFGLDADNGSTTYPLGSTSDNVLAGDYTLRCQGITGAGLAYGERIDWSGVIIQLGLLLLLSGLLGVIGLAVLIVMLVRRHKSKERARQAEAAAAYAGWYGYTYGGYQQYPGYQQQYPQPGGAYGGYPAPGQASPPPPIPPPAPTDPGADTGTDPERRDGES